MNSGSFGGIRPLSSLMPLPNKAFRLVNARMIDVEGGRIVEGELLLFDGLIQDMGAHVHVPDSLKHVDVIDCDGAYVAPGLIDMCAYVGEPGFENRESLNNAMKAAVAGGITSFLLMPNTRPRIDEGSVVDHILRRTREEPTARVYPVGGLTKGLDGAELTEMGLMQKTGAIAFCNGRCPVNSSSVMRNALSYARTHDALTLHVCEDADLASGGHMNEGEVATRLGLMGIPIQAETIQLQRDLALAGLTQARYHAMMLSCQAGFDLFEAEKQNNPLISCGVAIHNLALSENDIGSYRTFFKLKPPLRSDHDRRAAIDALARGVIDVIVSAHDPQDAETKRFPFAEAYHGAIGFETLLGVALRLVHSQDVDLMCVMRALTLNPARLLRLPQGRLSAGAPADVMVFDPDRPWVVSDDALVSTSKNTPFRNATLTGRVLYTIMNGHLVYQLAQS